VEQRPVGVDRRRAVPREQLERQERRAPRRRALVFQAPAEQLELLAEAELPDRAVGDRPLAKIGASRGALELVVPFGAKRRQLRLGACRRQLIGFRGG
jgi:hypothetical protein